MDSRRLLGIDGKGYTHRWDTVFRKDYVYDGDEFLGTFHVGDGLLSEHVEKIEAEFGEWQTLHFSTTPFAGIEVDDA